MLSHSCHTSIPLEASASLLSTHGVHQEASEKKSASSSGAALAEVAAIEKRLTAADGHEHLDEIGPAISFTALWRELTCVLPILR